MTAIQRVGADHRVVAPKMTRRRTETQPERCGAHLLEIQMNFILRQCSPIEGKNIYRSAGIFMLRQPNEHLTKIIRKKNVET